MHSRINEWLGKEFEDVTGFQTVNDLQDKFLSLRSRLAGLEYGSNGDAFKRNPMWEAIDMEMSDLADRITEIGSDARRGERLLEEIHALDDIVNILIVDVIAQ